MNELNFDLENIIGGGKTYRGQNPQFIYSPRQINSNSSPINKVINYINLNTNQKPKYISKNLNSNTNIKIQKLSSSNNIINKKEKTHSNERIFQKRLVNEQLESSLFKKKLKLKNKNQNDISNNKIMTSRQKIYNIDAYNPKVYLYNHEHKINPNSIIENKNNSFLKKYNNKRSSSVMNANKANEKLRELNNLTYKERLNKKKSINENCKTKISKTQNERAIINKIENINLMDDSDISFKNNKNTELEENHFQAVFYTQMIKNLNKNLN